MTKVVRHYRWRKLFPQSRVAGKMLKQVVSLVKPIMIEHNWKIGSLCECYRGSGNYWLGWNYKQGRKIALRLRHAEDKGEFLPMEEIVDTMLHELAHMRYSHHNHNFYRLWNELRHEFNILILNGHTGTLKKKIRLTSDPNADLYMVGRRRERAAMEEMRSAERTEVAEEAAEEEAVEEESAGEENAGEESAGEESAGEESVDEELFMHAAVDLLRAEREQRHRRSSAAASEQNPHGHRRPSAMESTNDFWDCEACTLRNSLNDSRCEVCGTARPGR